jgi:hypothetical protein
MEASPKNREISVVTGNASDIMSRGRDIKDLGDQMVGSAGVLKAIVDGADGQKGLSIEKVREVVGEIHVELRLAGERYAPTGTALVAYGEALALAQSRMRTIVPECETLWNAYLSKAGAYNDMDPWFTPVQLVPDDEAERAEERRQIRLDAARQAMSTAHDEFRGRATDFDAVYDDWRDAFDQAADSIGTATHGGVSDSRWDDLDGIVDGVLVVLQYVGIAVAILAFVIGGPIIAAIGAVIAIATLALTIYKAARGNATGWDMAFAIIGVIPFGSLAKFAGGARVGTLGFLDDMVGGLGTRAGWRTVFTTVGDFGTTWSTAGAQGASWMGRFTQAMGGSHAWDDIAVRMMGFGTAGESSAALALTRGQGWGIAGHVFGHYGWVINSPAQVVMTGIGLAQSGQKRSTVDTWEAELSAS